MKAKLTCAVIEKHIDMFYFTFHEFVNDELEKSEKNDTILFSAFLVFCVMLGFDDDTLDHIICEFLVPSYSDEKVMEIQKYYDNFSDVIAATSKQSYESVVDRPEFIWGKTVTQLLEKAFNLNAQMGIMIVQKFFMEDMAKVINYDQSATKKPTEETETTNAEVSQTDINNPIQSKKHLRHCKFCGGKLDNNKKCSKCGKQFFHINRFKTLAIFTCAIAICLGVSIYVLKQQSESLQLAQTQLQNTQSYLKVLESSYKIAKYKISCFNEVIVNTNNKIKETIEILRFYETTAVIVPENDMIYHMYGCEHVGDKGFFIFNIALAIGRGYTECPDCQADRVLLDTFSGVSTLLVPIQPLDELDEINELHKKAQRKDAPTDKQ